MGLRRHQHLAEARARTTRSRDAAEASRRRSTVATVLGATGLGLAWWPLPLFIIVFTVEVLHGTLEPGQPSITASLVDVARNWPDTMALVALAIALAGALGWTVLGTARAADRTGGGRRLIAGIVLAKVVLAALAVMLGIVPVDLVAAQQVALLGSSLFGIVAALLTMLGRQTARMILVVFLVLDVIAFGGTLAFMAVDPSHSLPWTHWLLAVVILVDFIAIAGIVLVSNRINRLCSA